MSIEIFKNIVALEAQVLQRGDGLSAEEARQFYNDLISYHEEFAKRQNQFWTRQSDGYSLCDDDYHRRLGTAEFVEKKITRLQKRLNRFIEPVTESASPIESVKVNSFNQNETDQPKVADNLNSLLQKQKFYTHVINSLVPEGELSSDEAELHFDHVSHIYKEFISIQSEVMTFVNGTAFDNQLNVFSEIQRKVLSLQKTLKYVSSSNNKLSAESKLKVNEHFNRTDGQNVIVGSLDSLYKKQKSLIEQIETEWIESKSDLGATEAETLHVYVSQLHEAFIQNQAKIVTYVDGPALDKELEMSREILVKVISLQTKLKEIFAPVVLPVLAQPYVIDESKPVSNTDEAASLTTLIQRQKSLMNDIESMKSFEDAFRFYQPNAQVKKLNSLHYYDKKIEVEVWLKNLLNFKQWFISNQNEIEKRVDGYDLQQQKKISEEIQLKLKKFQIEYEYYYSLFAYLDLSNKNVTSSYDINRVVSFAG